MARLTWTPEAAGSIREIYDFIAQNRPETARRTVESILNKIDTLTEYPDLGQPYGHDTEPSIRVFNYGHFRVAYLIEDGGGIVVLGVFHGLIFLPLQGRLRG